MRMKEKSKYRSENSSRSCFGVCAISLLQIAAEGSVLFLLAVIIELVVLEDSCLLTRSQPRLVACVSAPATIVSMTSGKSRIFPAAPLTSTRLSVFGHLLCTLQMLLEPLHRLQERTLLGINRDPIVQIPSHGKTMHHSAIQIDLIRKAQLFQNNLRLVTFLGWENRISLGGGDG